MLVEVSLKEDQRKMYNVAAHVWFVSYSYICVCSFLFSHVVFFISSILVH